VKVTVYAAYLGLLAAAAAANALVARWGWSPRRRWLVNVPLALAVAGFMITSSQPVEWLSDFRKAYYPAGRLWMTDPASMYGLCGPDELAFVNLPGVAVLLTPFALLPIRWARWVFTLLGMAAAGAAGVLLARRSRPAGWGRAAVVALFVANGPLYYSIREGNLTHVVLLLLVVALNCLDAGRDFWLGVVLAAAGLLKPPLGLLAAPFILRGRWRVVAGGAAALAGVGGLSLALCPLEAHRVWFDVCVVRYAREPLAAYNVQSVSGVLARLLTDAPLTRWDPLVVGRPFQLLNHLIVAGLAGAALLACRRPAGWARAEAARLEFGIILCLVVLVSPVSWTHYYLWLLVPAALALGGECAVPRRPRWVCPLLLAALLMSPPVVEAFSGTMWGRALASHYWAGGVLLLGTLCAARRQLVRPGGDLRLFVPDAETPARDPGREVPRPLRASA
jgi:hypothetical protein